MNKPTKKMVYGNCVRCECELMVNEQEYCEVCEKVPDRTSRIRLIHRVRELCKHYGVNNPEQIAECLEIGCWRPQMYLPICDGPGWFSQGTYRKMELDGG